MAADSFWTFLAASSVSGVCVCIAMQPPDTVRLKVCKGKTPRKKYPGMTNFFLFFAPCAGSHKDVQSLATPLHSLFFLIFFLKKLPGKKAHTEIENLQKTQSKIPSLVKSAALFIRIPLTASGRHSRLKVSPGGTKVCFFFFFFLLHFLKRIGADG